MVWYFFCLRVDKSFLAATAFFATTHAIVTLQFSRVPLSRPGSMQDRWKNGKLETMQVEKNLRRRGFKYVIGSDESGRGCIAGPVVTASCCILAEDDTFIPIPGVNDSKKLSDNLRTKIYQEMMTQPDIYAWRVAQRSNQYISESNILKATSDCFRESIDELVSHYNLPYDQTYSIVDGNTRPKLSSPIPCRAWVRGDAEVYSVALASIVAKVVRDRFMEQAHEQYPEYGFRTNKGYPTQDHILAIHKVGPCSELHRMSFKPLRGR